MNRFERISKENNHIMQDRMARAFELEPMRKDVRKERGTYDAYRRDQHTERNDNFADAHKRKETYNTGAEYNNKEGNNPQNHHEYNSGGTRNNLRDIYTGTIRQLDKDLDNCMAQKGSERKRGCLHCMSEFLNGMRIAGLAALLLLTPQKEIEAAKPSVAPPQPILTDVTIKIKEGDTFMGILKQNGIYQIFKKHGLSKVESNQVLQLLTKYIDDLIKSGQIGKSQVELKGSSNSINMIHKGMQLKLSKLLFDTKVPYTDGDEEGKEYSPVVISAFTPKNAKRYGMTRIATWPKSIAAIESFMEFENVMRAKQFAKRMKARVIQKLNEFAPDLSEAKKEKLRRRILSHVIVSAVVEFNKTYKYFDTSSIILHKDPEKAIIEFISKYPGWTKELEKQVNKVISETFMQSK